MRALSDPSERGVARLELPHTTDRMRPWWEAVAQITSRRANILVVGDSISEGRTVTNIETECWIRVLARLLNRQYIGEPGGEGYVPACRSLTPQPWTHTGSPTVNTGSTNYYGLGRRYLTLTTGQSASRSWYGDRIEILYTRGPSTGTMRIDIDGVTTDVATSNASLIVGAKWTSAALDRGDHTVTVSWLSGGVVLLEGGCFSDINYAKGVAVWDGSHSSYTAGDFTGDINKEAWAGAVASINPDLVILPLGNNDALEAEGGSYSPEIFATRIGAIIDLVKANSSTVPAFIYPLMQGSPTAYTRAYWDRHMAAVKPVVINKGGALVDLRNFISLGPSTGTTGLYADTIHPNAAGHRLWASGFYNFLPRMNYEPGGWVDGGLQSPWTDYGTPYRGFQYRLVGSRIELRGLVKTTSALSALSLMAKFSSYKPAAPMIFFAPSSSTGVSGGSSAANTGAASAGTAHTHTITHTHTLAMMAYPGRINVETDGSVNFSCNATNPIASGGWVSLDGISWDVSA